MPIFTTCMVLVIFPLEHFFKAKERVIIADSTQYSFHSTFSKIVMKKCITSVKKQHKEHYLQNLMERNRVLNLKQVSEGIIISWWSLELTPVTRMAAVTFISHLFRAGPEWASAELPGRLGLVKAWEGIGCGLMALGPMLGRNKQGLTWSWIYSMEPPYFFKSLEDLTLFPLYRARVLRAQGRLSPFPS